MKKLAHSTFLFVFGAALLAGCASSPAPKTPYGKLFQDATAYIKSLKEQGKLPGFQKGEHLSLAPVPGPAKEVSFPFSVVLGSSTKRDDSRYEYRVMKLDSEAPWQLVEASRHKIGRVAEQLVAKPLDFKTGEIENIWKELWKSGGPTIREPKVEKLSEGEAVRQMTGKWTVMFGVIPDKLTISLSTNRLVEVSGQKDGKTWKKTGQWRVDSDKLVLFLEGDDIPSFIFKMRPHDYIFDPWAKTMMSELKKEK